MIGFAMGIPFVCRLRVSTRRDAAVCAAWRPSEWFSHNQDPKEKSTTAAVGGMPERMPASCRLARMIGDWYLRKMEKQPNEVQTI
jgi:hypothetical protein